MIFRPSDKPGWRFTPSEPTARDFSPPLLRLQDTPPNPVGRAVLTALLVLLAALLLWAVVGKLDIVAVAEGRLVPQSYLKIVQPSESGIVKEILVREGEEVKAGQVLMRMDTLITDADARSLDAEHQRKRLTLRRIDAELGNRPFRAEKGDPPPLAREVEAQYRANRSAFEAALAEERSRLVKAKHDLSFAEQVKTKLTEVLPHYRNQDYAFEKLARDGYAGTLMASDKRRERIEKEQELKTQEFLVESTRASIQQSEKKLAQIDSDYRRQLYAERNEIQGVADKLFQEIAKRRTSRNCSNSRHRKPPSSRTWPRIRRAPWSSPVPCCSPWCRRKKHCAPKSGYRTKTSASSAKASR